MEQEERKTLSEILFEYAMKDRWEPVVETYKEDPASHTALLTASLDTVLHLAVSGGKTEEVDKLVKILGGKASQILKMKNQRGNTPLHTAAALGYSYMCHCMATIDSSLVAECNNENMTPLFVAALFGHEETFLCLHFLSKGKPLDASSRKANGDTFLHAALKGEFFSLAFQIIRKYPELVNDVNEDGFTPLHILATKPNAFKSGSRLGLFDRIIYQGIAVHEIEEVKHEPAAYLKRFERTKDPWYPQNYGTCAHFFHMLFGVIFYGLPWENFRPSEVSSCFRKTDEENVPEKNNPAQTSTNNHDIGPSKMSCFPKSDKENAPQMENPPQESNGSHGKVNGDGKEDEKDSLRQRYVPPHYATLIQSLTFLMNVLLIVLGHGFQRIKRIRTKKERHTMAKQVMNELIGQTSLYKFNEGRTAKDGESDINFDPRLTGKAEGVEEADKTEVAHGSQQHQVTKTNLGINSPSATENKEGSSIREGIVAPMEIFLKEYSITGTVDSKSSKHAVKMAFEKKVTHEPKKTETPILIAARMGVTEMVESILEKFPVSIQELDANNKNVLLLAVENRQTHTFRFLIDRKTPLHESVFRQWDDQGNNALHLAASYGEYSPWLIPGSALQMQWELKWYKFVKRSISPHLLGHYNRKNQTPKQIFRETHKSLVKDGSEWLTKTSESCSLVAALIATVAFATSATIPGGVQEDTGKPVLRNEPAFAVFSISSLVALCFSVTSLVFFLAILTSRFEEKDFAYKLPWKLILGLTALFTSIAAILVSFCAGHFFVLRDKLKFAAFPIYVVTCLPVSFFALAQLPLYFDLLRAIVKEIPQRSNKEFTR